MTDALSVAQEYFDAWNRHDAAGIVATFAEGGTYTDPLAPALTGGAIAAYAGGPGQHSPISPLRLLVLLWLAMGWWLLNG